MSGVTYYCAKIMYLFVTWFNCEVPTPYTPNYYLFFDQRRGRFDEIWWLEWH